MSSSVGVWACGPASQRTPALLVSSIRTDSRASAVGGGSTGGRGADPGRNCRAGSLRICQARAPGRRRTTAAKAAKAACPETPPPSLRLAHPPCSPPPPWPSRTTSPYLPSTLHRTSPRLALSTLAILPVPASPTRPCLPSTMHRTNPHTAPFILAVPPFPASPTPPLPPPILPHTTCLRPFAHSSRHLPSIAVCSSP